jgi:acyl carrier protein
MASREDVRAKMAEFLGHPVQKLQDDTVLTDRVTDSMILVNMVIDLQEEFRVRLMQDDLKEVKTVGHLLALFERKMSG